MKTSMKNKLDILKSSKFEDVTLLFDFDRTLTCGLVEGAEVTSIATIMREEDYLDSDYQEKSKKLFAKYRPIELDQTITKEEKKKLMHNWWQEHLELIIDKKLTKAILRRAAESRLWVVRPGVKDLFTFAHANGIQVVILSSSVLGFDSIRFFLEREGVYFPNVTIYSNQLVWNNEETVCGFNEPLVHSANKSDFITNEDVRENILLVGDGLHDMDMIAGLSDKNIVSVGIYESVNMDNVETYKNTFDLVLVNSEIDFNKIKNMLPALG
jgi:5'-nucleotidase